MATPRLPFGPNARLLLTILLAWVLLGVGGRLARLDRQFWQLSGQGFQGLLCYLIGDYRGAATAYRADLAQRLDHSEEVNPAWQALARGDDEEAGQLASQALEGDPSNLGALLTLGEVALEQNRLQDAEALFQQVVDEEPDQFDALLLASLVAVRVGEDARAIALINRALRTNTVQARPTTFLQVLAALTEFTRSPQRNRPPCLLAHYYRYLRIFDGIQAARAIAYAKRAVALGDHPADAYLTIGILHSKAHQRRRALRAIQQALHVDPRHAEALRWAAVLYLEQGDTLNEYRMIQAAVEAAPDDPFYLKHFEHLLIERLGDAHQAQEVLERARQRNPGDAWVLERLGYVYGLLGDYEKSAAIHRETLEHHPNNPRLHSGLAFALERSGQIEEAITAYQQAAAIAPFDPNPHARLANLYHGQERYPEAIAEYEQAVRLGERNPDRLAQLCMLYHLVSKFEQAAACFESVLARDPNQALAQRMLPEVQRNRDLQRQAR